jgi:hypothetical protein
MSFFVGRCFRSVDFGADRHSKHIPVDKKPNHHVVHAFHFGKYPLEGFYMETRPPYGFRMSHCPVGQLRHSEAGMRNQHQDTEEWSAGKQTRSVLAQREAEPSASRLYHIACPGPMRGGGASRGRLGMATVRPSYCTQCRTLRSTDQRGGFGTAFLPKIQ